MQEEAQEYKEESKLRELVAQYSEFINFPIYLWTTKETEVEVPDEEAEAAAAAAKEDAPDEEIEDEGALDLRRELLARGFRYTSAVSIGRRDATQCS